jgi:hypothetical protein
MHPSVPALEALLVDDTIAEEQHRLVRGHFHAPVLHNRRENKK